jgi:hypothetical protein
VQTETDVQNLCRLEAQRLGAVLWRNNVGAMKDERGVPVRFGLANDSKRINEVFKSSDLIGMTPCGRFFAVECKEPGWAWKDTDHERAQWAFIVDVRKRGGLAGFASHPDHIDVILTRGWGAHGL